MLIGYVNFRRLYAITKIQNVALQRNAYSLAGNRLLANPFPHSIPIFETNTPLNNPINLPASFLC